MKQILTWVSVIGLMASSTPSSAFTTGHLSSQWISVSEANSLAYLAYPQTEADMVRRYGFPNWRSPCCDWYRVQHQGRDYWAVVQYDTHHEAVNFWYEAN